MNALLEQLKSNDPSMRANAAEAIGNAVAEGALITNAMVAALLAAFDDSDNRVLLSLVWATQQSATLAQNQDLCARIAELERVEKRKRNPDLILLSEIGRLRLLSEMKPPNQPTPEQPPMASSDKKIFICYSHNDNIWLDRLLTALKPLKQANPSLSFFSDRDIQPGELWEQRLEQALQQCDIGVLLVTPSFLASEFIMERELPILLKKRVLAVAVSASGYKYTPLKDIQFVNDPKKPLDRLELHERNAALTHIVERVEQACQPTAAP